MKINQGFTLAEVLITLGVLGVVAAFTMPTLVNNYKKQTYATAIRKFTVDFEEAIDMYITDEGKAKFSQTSFFSEADGADSFFRKYLNVVKSCKQLDMVSYKCFAPAYNTLSHPASTLCKSDAYVLANGVSFCRFGNNVNISFLVDINNASTPNKGGRDLFVLKLQDSGEITDMGNDASVCSASNNYPGTGCLKYLQENDWKMDY